MGSQGITRAGKSVIARLMETLIWHLPAGSVGGGLSKGTMASASTSVWEKAAFPALTLMPNNSFPTYMSVMPFKLLPLRWSSEGVSANKSVCRPFKKNCLGLQKFPSSSASIPAVFHSQKLWGTLSSWHWSPGLWGLMWAWDILLLGGDLCSLDIFINF